MLASKLLLVDGYNVIHQIPELKQGLEVSLEHARQQLALLISRWSHIHPGVVCTIVFDGDQQFSGGRSQRLAGISCIFTRKRHGADAEIIRTVREYAGAKSDITVVSDDNSIRNNCRAYRATVHPASFILTVKSSLSHSPSGSKLPQTGKGISRKAEADITTELKNKFGF